jgi:hypothetical protein
MKEVSPAPEMAAWWHFRHFGIAADAVNIWSFRSTTLDSLPDKGDRRGAEGLASVRAAVLSAGLSIIFDTTRSGMRKSGLGISYPALNFWNRSRYLQLVDSTESQPDPNRHSHSRQTGNQAR